MDEEKVAEESRFVTETDVFVKGSVEMVVIEAGQLQCLTISGPKGLNGHGCLSLYFRDLAALNKFVAGVGAAISHPDRKLQVEL